MITDLDFFNLIVPCGITGGGVTSLTRAAGRAVAAADVEESLIHRFAEVFDRTVVETQTVQSGTGRGATATNQ